MRGDQFYKVNGKGQITIPADIRKRLEIESGTKVSFLERAGGIFVQPVTDQFISSMRGTLAGLGLPKKLKRDRD